MAPKAGEAERGHGRALFREKRLPLPPLRATEMPRASPGGSFPSVEGAANCPKTRFCEGFNDGGAFAAKQAKDDV